MQGQAQITISDTEEKMILNIHLGNRDVAAIPWLGHFVEVVRGGGLRIQVFASGDEVELFME